jgi:hypothetical protein
MPAVVVELQEQLLIWEKGLASEENALMAREGDQVATEHALGRARVECDVDHDRAEAIRLDYRARLHASTAGHQRSLDFDRVLCERQFILSVQGGGGLEQREEKLAKDQARGLYSFIERNLSVELEKLRESVAGVEDERAVEAVQPSWSVMEISDALVDLGVFPHSGCSYATEVSLGCPDGSQSHFGVATGGMPI